MNQFDMQRFSFKWFSEFFIRYFQQTSVLKIVTITCAFLLQPFFYAFPAGAAQTCNNSIIATAPETHFTINKDGTTIDNTTGLMWMRCSLGQEWNGKTCSGTATSFSWAAGLRAAADSAFAGYDNWRLPNKNELESIVESRCFAPAVNLTIFPATPPAYFWSSSPYAPVSRASWSIDFGYGPVNASVKSGSIHIRLVRDTE